MRVFFFIVSIIISITVYSVEKTKIDSLNTVIENSDNSEKFNTYIELAKIYYFRNSFSDAINTIKQALNLTGIDKIRIARANNFLGLIYYHIGDHPTALSYHLISLKLREETNNDTLIAVAQNSIAVVYTALNEIEKSNSYLEEALKVEIRNNNTNNIAMIYNNISNNYAFQGKHERALEYLLKSEAIIDDTNLDKALLLINIGKEYSALDSLDNAKYYYFTAIDYCKKTNNNYYLAMAYQYIGNLFLKLKDYKQSLFFLNSGLGISEKINALEISKDCYKGLINIYSIKQQADSITKYNKKYFAINDSIFNNKTADKIAELQIKYELEKKEKEIGNLIIKNQLADKKQKITIVISILTTLILLIIFLIVYYKKRKDFAEKIAVKKSIKLIKYEDEIDKTINAEKILETPKDTNSTLSEEFKTMLEFSISKKIRKDKLYLNNDFSLNELAKLLETNRRYVSLVINEKFGQNFSSFINEFRINEAMRLMSNPDYDKYTIESISKKVGFNSISAFNGAFKKVAGVTPSTFAKSVKK